MIHVDLRPRLTSPCVRPLHLFLSHVQIQDFHNASFLVTDTYGLVGTVYTKTFQEEVSCMMTERSRRHL